MSEDHIDAPIVKRIGYNAVDLWELSKKPDDHELLFDYPTVYLIYNRDKKGKYDVYVGETNDIKQRTRQHLIEDPKTREDWDELRISEDASMIIIGHNRFNKSLTLDIENKMMLYMSGITDVDRLNNRRENEQNKYFTDDIRDVIFSKIWRELRTVDNDLFPLERIIQDSAIFKASPFHKLTDEQNDAKNLILERVSEALIGNQTGQLILVEGEAGSGKTVLLSTIFYLMTQYSHNDEFPEFKNTRNFLLVNHDEQLKVYEDTIEKLGIRGDGEKIVSKPTTFINNHEPEDKVDVVLVDEAHLLWTQGKQSYRGKNQLRDIMARAKVTIAIFDPKQVLKTEEYLEAEQILALENHAYKQNNLIKLKNQLRINADDQTVDWIRAITDERVIKPMHKDSKGYDLRIFDDPVKMYHEIQKLNGDREKAGLSRLLATFDWPYKQKGHPDDSPYWMVNTGDLSLPWNLQLPVDESQSHLRKHLSWAEQSQTVDEVGSTYTIQGFDLNYAGVIIGPSVKYVDGKIVFDPELSENKNAVRNRTLSNGKKAQVSDELLANELNVLLTRGVNGLFIYAVDSDLNSRLHGEMMTKIRMVRNNE
ncbi:DUF2075 domain-containing protein [Secundilactobacillus paracollinoides]|uniref:ATP-dependent exonuclease n=1 Tax=Secundilactobacillus paracollinoides TaxID=240427 RepID=A0A1B2IYD8_9LACO|nr:DUF2075 domain-containing protein [Secundilactobacillus paracollinoides]ANZ61096.1 ATP-dependent exonuclease [Secundilactobacillus paracollinoides]ANZ67018.1 ATP-dependent exonuclease [Secundilactobacillus paracollinoides]